MNPILYVCAALLALVLALAGVDLWQRHNLTQVTKADAGAVAANTVEVADAKTDKDLELAQLRAYRDSHPDAVQLCKPKLSPVRAPKATSSSPAVAREPVHEPDNPVREGNVGRDIGPMLDAFGAVFDSVSADLREQQRVQ